MQLSFLLFIAKAAKRPGIDFAALHFFCFLEVVMGITLEIARKAHSAKTSHRDLSCLEIADALE